MWFHAGPKSNQDPSVKMSYGPNCDICSNSEGVSHSGGGCLCCVSSVVA